MITTEQVKALRDQTGVSIMQCKKALEESEGDMEKALMILKKKSSDIAAKKSDREAKDGLVVLAEGNGKIASIVVRCETDFVSKNDDFVALANNLSEMALTEGAEAVQANAKEKIDSLIQKIGENIELGDIQIVTGETLGSYNHNGKNAVIVSLKGGSSALARDIAMHIAAMKPEYTSREDIAPEMIEKVRGIFTAEVEASDKPAEIKEKMMQGKIDAYFRELTLLEQPFVKDGERTIAKILADGGASIISQTRITL